MFEVNAQSLSNKASVTPKQCDAHQHPRRRGRSAISLQPILAGLIMRAAAPAVDRFLQNTSPILAVRHLNSSFLWKITGTYEWQLKVPRR